MRTNSKSPKGVVMGDLVVGANKVHLGENVASMECGGEILDVEYWVAVGDGYFVQSPIIATGAPIPRGLLGYHV